MPEVAICKRIMSLRAEEFRNDPMKGNRNEHGSPLLEIFKVCEEFGMLDICLRMAINGCHLSKTEWKNMQLQYSECTPENNHTLMYRVIDKPCYLIWWILSDRLPGITGNCEIMAKLVCNASLLKDHDYRLK